MLPYLGHELEAQRRRGLDETATAGARRHRWEREARERRESRGRKATVVDGGSTCRATTWPVTGGTA